MMSRTMASFWAGALLAGSAAAQVTAGSVAPAFAFEKTWNGAPASFDELAGKVVVLKFSETW